MSRKKHPGIIRVTMMYMNKGEGDTKQYPLTLLIFNTNSDKSVIDNWQDFLWQEIKWYDETELMYRNIYDIKRVEVSLNCFTWGGLKWTTPKNFQGHLNREGCCRKSDPPNPNPRHYPRDFTFFENPAVTAEVENRYKAMLRHLA